MVDSVMDGVEKHVESLGGVMVIVEEDTVEDVVEGWEDMAEAGVVADGVVATEEAVDTTHTSHSAPSFLSA